MLPDKYGVNKYQNSDYMIANTTGPISAVLHDEAANISYKGAKEDLEHIVQVVPAEYIYEYGCNGGFYWNAVSGRWVRQSGATKEEAKALLLKYVLLDGYKKSLNNSGIADIVKLALMGILFFYVLAALLQRNYWYFLSALLNLAILAVIILMAPWSRPNYYYYTFEIMYWNVLQFIMCKK